MATASLDFHSGLSSLSIIGPWSCSICSSNDMTGDHPLCEACQQKFLQPTTEKPTSNDVKIAWQCPRCTLYNTDDHERCNSCGKSKFTLVSL